MVVELIGGAGKYRRVGGIGVWAFGNMGIGGDTVRKFPVSIRASTTRDEQKWQVASGERGSGLEIASPQGQGRTPIGESREYVSVWVRERRE